jgi:hypothetical protein
MRELHPLDRAQRDIDIAVYAAIVSGTLTLVFSLLVLMAHTASGLEHMAAAVDVAADYGLAYGIARRSRVAAIAALALLILNTAFRLAQRGLPSGLVGAVVFGYCYVRGIRGVFAYRSLRTLASQRIDTRAPAA